MSARPPTVWEKSTLVPNFQCLKVRARAGHDMVDRETDVWEDPSSHLCPRPWAGVFSRGELAILGLTKVSGGQGWSLDLAWIVWLVLRPAVHILLLTSDQGIARVGPKVWLEVRGCSSVLLGFMACGSGSDFHVELAGGLQRGVFPVARA